jgi:hypothetical protein
MLQLSLPELRGGNAVRNLNIELGRADYDLDEWRYASLSCPAPPPSPPPVLKVMRPKRIVLRQCIVHNANSAHLCPCQGY